MRQAKRIKSTSSSSSSSLSEVETNTNYNESGGNSSDIDTVNATTVLSYVEFYSGIGGWTMALEEALGRLNNDMPPEICDAANSKEHTSSSQSEKLQLHPLAAFDHSDVCRLVFEHNFGQQGTTTTLPIEKLTLKQVESWSAAI